MPHGNTLEHGELVLSAAEGERREVRSGGNQLSRIMELLTKQDVAMGDLLQLVEPQVRLKIENFGSVNIKFKTGTRIQSLNLCAGHWSVSKIFAVVPYFLRIPKKTYHALPTRRLPWAHGLQ